MVVRARVGQRVVRDCDGAFGRVASISAKRGEVVVELGELGAAVLTPAEFAAGYIADTLDVVCIPGRDDDDPADWFVMDFVTRRQVGGRHESREAAFAALRAVRAGRSKEVR